MPACLFVCISKAKKNVIDYHYLLVPQALTVNFSFMFPAAAPTNALVFACGYLKLKDMVEKSFFFLTFGFTYNFSITSAFFCLIYKKDDIRYIPQINWTRIAIYCKQHLARVDFSVRHEQLCYECNLSI